MIVCFITILLILVIYADVIRLNGYFATLIKKKKKKNNTIALMKTDNS